MKNSRISVDCGIGVVHFEGIGIKILNVYIVLYHCLGGLCLAWFTISFFDVNPLSKLLLLLFSVPVQHGSVDITHVHGLHFRKREIIRENNEHQFDDCCNNQIT